MERSSSAKPRGQYHHGDLRAALLATALDILETEGWNALTLRAVAARLGVSHAAPVYHFPTKNDLLLALAEEGFRLLADELVAVQGEGLERLTAVGQAYLGFASRYPQHFRLMFGPELPRLGYDHPGYVTESERAFAVLVEVAGDQGAPGGLGEGTLYAWSLVHGLAMLSSGPLPSRLPEGAGPWFEALRSRVLAQGLAGFPGFRQPSC